MAVFYSLLAATIEIVGLALGFYMWVLIVGAVLSWLVAFDIVNPRQRLVYVVGDFCARLTEPALRRIRRFLPATGAVDLSPMVLVLAIIFLQSFLRNLLVY